MGQTAGPAFRLVREAKRTNKMRKTLLLGTTVLVFAFGARAAYAMGGSGNLSPFASPYAILAPQTLGPLAVPPQAPPETPPAYAPPRHRPHRPPPDR
jgi:hypothetical protein